MANGIASIHVRVQRKKLTVFGMGQTNRGQKFIKNHVAIEATRMSDKNFKNELAAAVDEILGSEEPMLPYPVSLDNRGG